MKLLDESASVKELPGQEDGEDGAGGDRLNVIREQKNDDDGPSAQRLLEQQQEQQRVIEETNAQLQAEARKREEMEALLAEMEERMVIGGHALEEKESQIHQE